MAFVVLEGIDGSGKTSAIQYLAQLANEHGISVVTTREPGGTPFGEAVRTLLKSELTKDTDPRTQADLISAQRREHARQLIKPALVDNKLVLCDRWVLSTFAYQGLNAYASIVASISGVSHLKPDITIYLRVSANVAMRRYSECHGDWLDSKNVDDINKRLQIYEWTTSHSQSESYKSLIGKLIVIEADDNIEAVQVQLKKVFEEHILPRKGAEA